jgi:hypothetical protein
MNHAEIWIIIFDPLKLVVKEAHGPGPFAEHIKYCDISRIGII